MTFKHKLSRRLALLFSATAVVALAMDACEIPVATTPPADVAQLIISPKTATVQPDQDLMLTAVAFTAQGDTAQASVSWSATGGTVSDTSTNGRRHYGHWKNASCGNFKVAATSHPGGKSDTASVTVTCPTPVASVSVSPPAASVLVSATVQLTATPKDANGTPLSGRTVTWASSNTSVATVNGSGLVTGAAAGSATITATSEGQSGSATVTVQALPPGCSASSLTWQNSAFTAQTGAFTAQFDATPNGTGLDGVTGLSAGAAAGYADLAVIVRFNGVGQIDARNGAAYAAANAIPYTAGTSYRFRLVVDIPSHTYAAYVTPAGGTEATIGTGFAFRTEQATVTSLANWALYSDAGTHTVCNFAITGTTPPVPVATVDVTPATANVPVGGTVQLTATPKDANGTPLSGRTVSWSSSNPSVASVTSSGQVTGVAAGSATITATSEGKSGTSAITVTAVPVAAVTVSPGSATVQVGQTVQLTATPKDANGNPLSGRAVAWSSSNPSVASVTSSGLVTGVAIGSATITATSEGQSGTASITVSNVPVAAVSVSPASAALQVGQTVQLTATPKDANGNPLSGRTVTWASSNPSVASVTSSGLVTGVTAGSATITATSEGQNGTSAITVTAVPVASVSVTPASASVNEGKTVQLTATPKDANGNPLTGRTVTWASSNTAVATVSASGLVTGKVAGTATITATSEGQSGTSAITVVHVPVAAVSVSPATASVQVGSTLQLTATPKDANGNPLSGRTVTWASSTPAVATVSANGLVTGVTVGSATITATSEGQSGTAAITVVAASASVVLVGAGDIADCSGTGDEATAALLDNIAGTVFTAGDNVYPDGTDAQFTQCYDPSWGRHKARTRPTPGNHDYHTTGASAYYHYFGALAGDSGKGYFSYDIGAWHIISLNSNVAMSAGSAQETWLRQDLAASTKQCTIAYWHHPRFSSGTQHGSTSSTQPLWQALYDAGAEIVISGHEHNYERFAPQTPTGTADPTRGIREFVVGTGGESHYNDQGTPLPNSELFNGTTFGVLKLTLGSGTYSWQFVPVAGQTFTDSGSGTCH